MTLYTRLVIDGIDYSDFENTTIDVSTSEYGISSKFIININSVDGKYSTTFNVGDSVVIYIGTSSPATTKIFSGFIENIDFIGKGISARDKIKLFGRDYTSRLQDVTIEPEVYTNKEVSVIVKDIIDKYVTGITYTNVDTTPTTIPRIAFNQTTVYDGLQRLANLSGYIFYIDTDQDLHFERKDAIVSGSTLDNTNVLEARAVTTRKGLSNTVWVYGDRYLTSAPTENLSAGSPFGGSVFTLVYKPHSTRVSYLGTIQKGGIYGDLTEAGSNTNYLVNFYDRQLIFTSGTNIGDSIPVSGGSIIVDYNRDIPIVKVGRDRASINLYGPVTKVITDKDIKDPQSAMDRVKVELDAGKEPPTKITTTLKTTTVFTPGNTATVNLPDYNISSQDYIILSVKYKLTPETSFTESAINLSLNKKIIELTDTLADMYRDIQGLKGADISDTDIITRLETFTGSVGVRQSGLVVSTRTATGDVMIWGNPRYNTWGTDKWGTEGSAFNSWAIQYSGGYPTI